MCSLGTQSRNGDKHKTCLQHKGCMLSSEELNSLSTVFLLHVNNHVLFVLLLARTIRFLWRNITTFISLR